MQAMKQSGNMGFVKRNAEFLGDDFGDSRGGPSLSAKPVGFGTSAEEIGNQPQLIERQSARSTWSWFCHRRCLAAKACRSEPMTDSTAERRKQQQYPAASSRVGSIAKHRTRRHCHKSDRVETPVFPCPIIRHRKLYLFMQRSVSTTHSLLRRPPGEGQGEGVPTSGF